MRPHLVVICGGLLLACGDGARHHRLRDTTGASFEFSCREQGCEIVRLDDGGCGSVVLLDGARFLVVTTDDSDGIAFSENGRIVTCESDQDCERSHNFPAVYECRMGLCEDPGWDPGEITRTDVFALCLADVSRDAYCRTAVFDAEPGPELARAATEACASQPGDALFPRCSEVPSECAESSE